MTFLRRLDHVIGGFLSALQWLALPLVVLLFLQWPLRDIFKAYSREANDLGQIIFALFVAASVTDATRAGTHLAADTLAQRYSAHTRHRIKQVGTAIGMVHWALFFLIAGKSIVVPSIELLEAFPDTYNPGYYIIKAALWLMALLILAQSAVDVFRPLPKDDV
jgi:TRAP-type mannitol/chloroaromatic compound transport system permease small subunit